jgi:hypothetical protein
MSRSGLTAEPTAAPPGDVLNSPAGRDAPLPAWLKGGNAMPERPRFDSVVVRGNGVGALVLAARLARTDALKGRVRIAAPRPVESRRLVNGCTLRARSLDYYGAALGCTPASLVEALFGARAEVAEARAQRVCLAREEAPGRFALGAITRWMGADHDSDPVVSYGLRNGHLVGLLAERVAALGVPFDDDTPETFEACLRRADGDRPLVVNGSHAPVSDLSQGPAPERFVVASQLPLRRRSDSPLPSRSSSVVLRRRERAFDTGVFYPFADPLTVDADYYGIVFRVVRPDAGFEKPAALAAMRGVVEGVADALGMDPVDADETRGEAMVPCFSWGDVGTPRPDWLDLHRTYSACTPIITGDGMARAGLAGWVAAEAILAGEDPVPITNRSLRLWRRANREFHGGMTRLSGIGERLLRLAPGLMKHVGAKPDMWAGIR